MTDRYVDVTLAETTAAYDPDTRASTGGSDAGYKDFIDAYAAASNGDILIARSGTDTSITSTKVIAKNIELRPYPDETYTVYADFDNHIFQFGTGAAGLVWNCKFRGGHIVFQSTGVNATKGVFQLVSQAVTINDPKCVLGDETTTGISVVALATDSAAAQTCKINRIHAIGAGKMIHNVAATNMTFEFLAPYCQHCGFINISSDATIYIYNPFIIPAFNEPAISRIGGTVELNVYNPTIICVGHGDTATTYAIQAGSAPNVCNLFGGSINGNAFDPHDRIYSGNVVLDGTDLNKFARFKNMAASKAIVSIIQADSSIGAEENSVIDQMIPILEGLGATMTWAPDDSGEFLSWAAKGESARAWHAAGQEIAAHSASSDLPYVAEPVSLTYDGTDTDAQLVISENGTVWTLTSTSGSDDLVIDTSRTTTDFNGELGLGIPDGSAFLVGLLADNNYTLAAIGDNNLDDTFAYVLEDGTYVGLKTVGTVAIPYNQDRHWDQDVDIAVDEMHSAVPGLSMRTYHIRGGTDNEEVAGLRIRIAAKGLGIIVGPVTDAAKLTVNCAEPVADPLQIQLTFGLTATAAILGDKSQDEIEQGARVVATTAWWFGGWYTFNIGPSELTAEQLGWFVTELDRCGITLLSVKDAYDWITANYSTVTIETDGADKTMEGDLALSGVRFWPASEAPPKGHSGEPWSNFDIGVGLNQPTDGPFHTANR